LWLGFLLGLRHALEPDHLAAVAAMASRGGQLRATLRVGLAWGAGHAAVVLVAGGARVRLGATLPPGIGRQAQLAGGTVLLLLGIGAVRRRPADASASRLPARAFLVGALHGFEGSTALVVLVLPALHGTLRALGYLAAFGAGSILGMLACSLIVSRPLRRLAG